VESAPATASAAIATVEAVVEPRNNSKNGLVAWKTDGVIGELNGEVEG